jgi:hypothetical protein
MGMEKVKYIKLGSNGHIAIVDAEDYDDLVKHKWGVKKGKSTAYAVRHKKKNEVLIAAKKVRMHREILSKISEIPEKMVIDHINHNGLDNRKANLRVCTVSENVRNSRTFKNKKVKYKGVFMDLSSAKNPYRACIRVDGKRISLGQYPTPEKAARAYNAAAVKYFGAFAYLNDVPDTDEEDSKELTQSELELS